MKETIRDVLTGLRVVSCIAIPIVLIGWLIPPIILLDIIVISCAVAGVLAFCGVIGAFWRSGG